ncbi:hypothetical protein C0J52_23699 [Blattella germanica]|nr:hypothetical protein C0J52_23699 [Blattella germanica]
MEAADILGALQARIATLPGGRDIEGRPLLLVAVPSETQPWNKDHLDIVLRYFISIFSPETRRNGLAVVLDAQRSAWRMARTCIRQVGMTLGADAASIVVLRPEAFWDKQRMDNCARTQKEGEYVEAFTKDAEGAVSDLEKLRQRLTRFRSGVRVSSVEEALCLNREMFDNTKDLAHKQIVCDENRRQGKDLVIPQDVLDTKDKVERLLEIMHGKEELIEEAWIDMEKSFVDAKEINTLEEGVSRVTNWILGPAEMMLNGQQEVGFDVISAEELRQEHETLELQCRDTYGHYAELLHKIDSLPRYNIALPEDLKSQRDFMDFVCRSFATRLERRRNVLITSLRFFRLVSEYFDRTNEVLESLLKCDNVEDLESADTMLVELQESQINIEGEKLADILSMPVKDALGRDVEVNYESDIANVLEILDAATARKNIFSDSVELHKLTLAQVSHIRAYETDAAQAVQWELMEAVKMLCPGSRLHKFLISRERLLLEVGRMVRLGRLLRTRLREPLCPEQT